METGFTTLLKVLVFASTVIAYIYLYLYYDALVNVKRCEGVELSYGFGIMSLWESKNLLMFLLDALILLPQPFPFVHFSIEDRVPAPPDRRALPHVEGDGDRGRKAQQRGDRHLVCHPLALRRQLRHSHGPHLRHDRLHLLHHAPLRTAVPARGRAVGVRAVLVPDHHHHDDSGIRRPGAAHAAGEGRGCDQRLCGRRVHLAHHPGRRAAGGAECAGGEGDAVHRVERERQGREKQGGGGGTDGVPAVPAERGGGGGRARKCESQGAPEDQERADGVPIREQVSRRGGKRGQGGEGREEVIN
eukprot:763038-Hanusia_phi.AAC.2